MARSHATQPASCSPRPCARGEKSPSGKAITQLRTTTASGARGTSILFSGAAPYRDNTVAATLRRTGGAGRRPLVGFGLVADAGHYRVYHAVLRRIAWATCVMIVGDARRGLRNPGSFR